MLLILRYDWQETYTAYERSHCSHVLAITRHVWILIECIGFVQWGKKDHHFHRWWDKITTLFCRLTWTCRFIYIRTSVEMFVWFTVVADGDPIQLYWLLTFSAPSSLINRTANCKLLYFIKKVDVISACGFKKQLILHNNLEYSYFNKSVSLVHVDK